MNKRCAIAVHENGAREKMPHDLFMTTTRVWPGWTDDVYSFEYIRICVL